MLSLSAAAAGAVGEMLVSTSHSLSAQTQLTSFVLHPKLSLVLLQYDFRVAFLSPVKKIEESFDTNAECHGHAHLADYFFGFFFDAGTSAFLGGFSAKLTFRLWPVKISGKS